MKEGKGRIKLLFSKSCLSSFSDPTPESLIFSSSESSVSILRLRTSNDSFSFSMASFPSSIVCFCFSFSIYFFSSAKVSFSSSTVWYSPISFSSSVISSLTSLLGNFLPLGPGSHPLWALVREEAILRGEKHQAESLWANQDRRLHVSAKVWVDI